MSELITQAQRELIEKLGVMHEQHGLPRAESRILSMMLIADKLELTFDEICETLQLSKSAVSTALNSLLATHRITYVTKPGDRKRYFTNNIVNWEKMMSLGLSKMLDVNTIMEEALNQRTPETPEFNESMRRFIDFINYMNREMPLLLERWQKERSGKETIINHNKK